MEKYPFHSLYFIRNKKDCIGVANLINSNLQLQGPICYEKVFDEMEQYRIFLDPMEKYPIACVQVVSRSWYHAELIHLVVHSDYRRKGFARRLLNDAESTAKVLGCAMLQCTVSDVNHQMRSLLESSGWKVSSSFRSRISNNHIHVYQKVH